MPRTKIGDPRTLLGELERWVIIETPTTDAARVNALMDFAAGGLAEAGVSLTRIPGRDGYGDNSIARIDRASGREADPRGRPLGHRLVDRHLGDDAFSRRRRPRLRPRHPGHEGWQLRRRLCGARDSATARADQAADNSVADSRRGSRQPDQSRDHRGRGRRGGAGADPGGGGSWRRLRDGAQGRRPL